MLVLFKERAKSTCSLGTCLPFLPPYGVRFTRQREAPESESGFYLLFSFCLWGKHKRADYLPETEFLPVSFLCLRKQGIVLFCFSILSFERCSGFVV